MKASNLSRQLVVSFSTFQNLVIPILAFSMLGAAGFGAFTSSTINNKLGSRKSLTFFHRHFWAMVIFFILSAVSKQLRFPTRREIAPLCLVGIIGIFFNQQMVSKNRGLSGPYYLSLWQPLIPVFVQGAVIAIGLEKYTPRKLIGVFI